jgi:hypothetical protein
MITRNKEVNSTDEMKVITICCEEAIEQQIIPELSLIYTIKINRYEDFLKYICLIESIVKSAAIVQNLRHIHNNLQLDRASNELTQEINLLKQNQNIITKYNNIFELYYHDQPRINTFLTTSESLFSHRTYVADLQYIVSLAHKGMSYTTNIAQYELPATYYCYTKKFNNQFSGFLQNIINDTYDKDNKKLYTKYNAMPISIEAFSSVITTLAFRLQLAVNFIEQFYSSQDLIEESRANESKHCLDEYFLKFVGDVRAGALLG